MDLEPGKIYRVVKHTKVCVYDANDCVMTDAVDLPIGTLLTYIGPDADDGDVFVNPDGVKFCLHANDLAAIEVA